MSFFHDEFKIPCIFCHKLLECCSLGGTGWSWDEAKKKWVTYSCNHCLVYGVESRMTISYYIHPEEQLNYINISSGDINLEINYLKGSTKISQILPNSNYGNRVTLDCKDLLSLKSAVSVNFSSKETIDKTITYLLTFK